MKLHELKAVEGSTKARKRMDLVLVLVKLQVKVKKDKTLEVAVE